MKDRSIRVPNFDLSCSTKLSQQADISNYTTPELNKLRKLCNFTEDEQEYFNLRSAGKSNVAIAMSMCVSDSKVSILARNVKSKIKRVS